MRASSGFTVQCCVCRRVRDARGKFRQAQILPGARVSHTYCPDCYDEATGEIPVRNDRARIRRFRRFVRKRRGYHHFMSEA